jgi:predicted MFS family arabinose efflux permease
VSFTEAVNAAFVRRRGFALGVTLAGSGLFILFVKPFAHFLVVALGWRLAIVGIGLLPLVIGVSAVRWGFPKHVSRTSSGKAEATSKQSAVGLTLGEAVRTRAFWLMIFILIPISFASAAPFPNMENILRSVHLDANYVVELTSLLGAMMIIGRLLGGWMMDRIWAPLVGLVFVLGAGVGSWLLTQHAVTSTEALFAIILLGLAAGSEGGLMSFLAVRYFGVRHYGVIYGTIFGVFAVGAAAGPSLFGYAFDQTGSYAQILTVCTGLFIFAAVLLAFLGRYPDLVRQGESP